MKLNLRKMSLGWKLLAAFLGFTLVMLALLWVFQVLLLDSFYKGIKIQDLNSAADTLLKNADQEELDEYVQGVAAQNDLCILIVDTRGRVQASADTLPDCWIHTKMTGIQLMELYMAALENGGRHLETMKTLMVNFPNQGFRFSIPEERESVILAQVIPSETGPNRILLLNSTISPVTATVRTLQIQLALVTGIMIVLSLGLSVFLARRLSVPIAKVNQSAKKLAEGDYAIRFDGAGYREIAELNETLNTMAQDLSKAEGLRRELLANISHDLRTPLTMITGYSEMMRDIPGENTPENVQIVIDEASRLTRLVNDLLDLSKLEAGVQELTVIRLNLSQMIADILTRYSKLTEQDGYQICTDILPDIWVDADESKLSQVLYNLINNAVNYTGEDRKVSVSLRLEDGWARVEVKDTGLGIPADKLDSVWERYYKLDRSHRRAAVGTGLGLSIVKNVLELHKARYGVESSLGKGSTFWFALPVSGEEDS